MSLGRELALSGHQLLYLYKGSWIQFKLLSVLGEQPPTLPFIKQGSLDVGCSVFKDCLWGDSRHFSFSETPTSSRKTQNLPARAFSLTLAECLRIFVHAIFYVGKGTRTRPNAHLWKALSHRGWPGKQV